MVSAFYPGIDTSKYLEYQFTGFLVMIVILWAVSIVLYYVLVKVVFIISSGTESSIRIKKSVFGINNITNLANEIEALKTNKL